jgi:hypothetical protein
MRQRLSDAALQPAPCILPFREDDETPAIPIFTGKKVGSYLVDEPTHASVRPGSVPLRDDQHFVDNG